MRKALCHPEEKHFAKDLCQRCYVTKVAVPQKRVRRKNGVEKAQARVRDLAAYGLSPEDYARALADQNNACAICGCEQNGRLLGIDHDHTTGRFRGLLCDLCNIALGNFSDDPTLLTRAIEYLTRVPREERYANLSDQRFRIRKRAGRLPVVRRRV